VFKLPEKPESERMPTRQERDQMEQDKMKQIQDQQVKEQEIKNQNSKKEENKDKKPKEKEMETSQKHSEHYHRELTKAEKRVKFDDIRIYMDEAEKTIANKMSNILNREKSGLLSKFEEAIRSRDYAQLHNLRWQLKGVYTQMFQEEMKRMFEYGKLKASYEVGKPAPMTNSEISKYITDRAVFLANRHEKQLMDKLKGAAAVAMMDPEVTDEQAMSGVKNGFDEFISRNVSATASLITSEEINNGRIFTFEQYKGDIYGYQWSSILDGGTCNYCMSMDGRTIGVEDKAFSSYKPGDVHLGCRCIWVAIMKDEANPPPYTGIPETLRPQSQVPAWDFKDIDYPLPGSGKRQMPYGIGVYHEKH
jgi:phosphohistidine swiveling domain-containing protein